MPGETIKQRAIQALQTLPDDATIDDAIERLCLIAKSRRDCDSLRPASSPITKRSRSAFSRDDDSLDRSGYRGLGGDPRIHPARLPHYASVVVARLIRAVARLRDFRQSGRVVPEFERSAVREIVERPYRIIYRLVRDDEVHILTVHHDGQSLPVSAGWAPEFLEGLRHVDDDTVEAVDDMLEDMKQARRSNPARDPALPSRHQPVSALMRGSATVEERLGLARSWRCRDSSARHCLIAPTSRAFHPTVRR